jgi:lipopolysaccharide/colanic/teichoic acid biosynthesis glycosyltransferase
VITLAPEAHPRKLQPAQPRLWGLDPSGLHQRFWASRGIQVVMPGSANEIVRDADLYLLIDARTLALFPVRGLIERYYWVDPYLMIIRVHEPETGYRERVVAKADGEFVRVERIYGHVDHHLARVGLTKDSSVARVWQRADSARAGWKELGELLTRRERCVASVKGTLYASEDPEDTDRFCKDLMKAWVTPSTAIDGVDSPRANVWAEETRKLPAGLRTIGPVWVGAGHPLPESGAIVGPVMLWDDPASSPKTRDVRWRDLEPVEVLLATAQPKKRSSISRMLKRAFDVVFATLALLVTLPLYPFIALAIWWEDGRPIFFGHGRESVGGREFTCWKFRSMRNNSHELTEKLLAEGKNRGDGGRVFIPEDEDLRLTKVGRFLRKSNLDEIPQFFNVLMGDMSVVGPRPSPRKENQFCPAWREARLSVRPGVTGLWQVMRTRRLGGDFQEWIKYDLEYVERAGLRTDLWIIYRTIAVILRRGAQGDGQ